MTSNNEMAGYLVRSVASKNAEELLIFLVKNQNDYLNTHLRDTSCKYIAEPLRNLYIEIATGMKQNELSNRELLNEFCLDIMKNLGVNILGLPKTKKELIAILN